MAKEQIPYPVRVQLAVDKIGAANGTRIPDVEVPEDIRSNNEQANAYIEKHSAVRELLVAGLINSRANARYENAKARTKALLNTTSLVVGDNKSYVFGNVSCTARAQGGQRRLNRNKVITKLMMDHKLTLEQAGAFVDDCEDKSAPSIYLTPATVAE